MTFDATLKDMAREARTAFWKRSMRRYVRVGPLPKRTPVTDAAIQQLQRALPKLEIRH